MKQTYTYEVNGFQIHAEYEEKDIETIFIPLLKKWKEMQKKAGRRILVFLSAPPGTGKTTLVQFLEYLSEQEADMEPIQAIGLDGFHYHQEYILSHDIEVDGCKVPMKDVKGCPETFDIKKLKEKIGCLKKGDTKWPVYDRKIHDVRENAVDVKKEIVLIEGNWLLLKEKPWDILIKECDDSVFISADETLLKERLIHRKMMGGLNRKEAEAFYEKSDRKNIRRLMNAHWQTGEMLVMDQDGSYMRKLEGESV